MGRVRRSRGQARKRGAAGSSRAHHGFHFILGRAKVGLQWLVGSAPRAGARPWWHRRRPAPAGSARREPPLRPHRRAAARGGQHPPGRPAQRAGHRSASSAQPGWSRGRGSEGSIRKRTSGGGTPIRSRHGAAPKEVGGATQGLPPGAIGGSHSLPLMPPGAAGQLCAAARCLTLAGSHSPQKRGKEKCRVGSPASLLMLTPSQRAEVAR